MIHGHDDEHRAARWRNIYISFKICGPGVLAELRITTRTLVLFAYCSLTIRARVLHFNLTLQSEEEPDFMEMEPIAPLMDLPVGTSIGNSRFGGNLPNRRRGAALDRIRNMVAKMTTLLLELSNSKLLNRVVCSVFFSFCFENECCWS